MGRPARERPDRVEKPYPEFPLTPHPNGQWCKSIKGRVYYFGHWENWEEALAIYTARRPDIEAGRLSSTRVTVDDKPPAQSRQGITVVELVNHFLTVKEQAVQAGTLSPRTFVEYDLVAGQMVKYFGRIRPVPSLQPVDFMGLKSALGQGKTGRISPERLGKLITIARVIFNYGAKNGLHPPVLFGTEFVKPKAEQLRRLRAKLQRGGRSKKLFTSQEVRDLLEVADDQMRAMILLAVNGGLGNNDIALLPFSAIDLRKGIIDYPRPKTGLDRRIPLWPETVAAVKQAVKNRPARAKTEHEDLVFLTCWGNPWVRFDKRREKCKKDNPKSPLTHEFRKLMEKIGIRREHRGFYALRHAFRTVADEVLDQGAIDMIMGHQDSSYMGSYYVEQRDLRRLTRVVEHVRIWLWPRSAWPRKAEEGRQDDHRTA